MQSINLILIIIVIIELDISDTKFTNTIVSVIFDIFLKKRENCAFVCLYIHFLKSVTNKVSVKPIFGVVMVYGL